jgi:hypothetical protein
MRNAPTSIIDLLARCDPRTHAFSGRFQIAQGILKTPKYSDFARIRLPARLPEEYRLSVRVRRAEGRGSFRLGLVADDRQCMVVLDSEHGGVAGLNLIDGKACANNETTYHHSGGFLIRQGVESNVTCEVRREGIRVESMKMKYRVHRFDMGMRRGELEEFLNSLTGEVATIIPHTTINSSGFLV